MLGGDARVRELVDRFYDLMDLEPGYRELRAALRDIKTALAVLDGTALLASARTLRDELATHEARAVEMAASHDAFAERLEAQDAVIASLTEVVEAAQEELRVARSRRDQVAGQRDALARRIEELEIDVAGCAERVAELEGQRNARRGELEAGFQR